MNAFEIRTPRFIPLLTSLEIQNVISEKAAVLIPVCGMEPMGEWCASGAAAACCFALCDMLSMKTGILLAPPVLFGLGTPFQAFAGCSGMRPATFEAAMTQMADSYIQQGCAAVYCIDGSSEGDATIRRSVHRVQSHRRAGHVHLLSWQHDKRILEFIKGRSPAYACASRCEYGIISMACVLDKALVRQAAAHASEPAELEAADAKYTAWRRRGRDPRRLKKLFPVGSILSGPTGNPQLGRELLEFIAEHFAQFIHGCEK